MYKINRIDLKIYKKAADEIISDKVLGCDYYRRFQLAKKRKEIERRKKDQQNFKILVMFILLSVIVMLFLKYKTLI